jgi:hypothetical protein
MSSPDQVEVHLLATGFRSTRTLAVLCLWYRQASWTGFANEG